MGTAVLTSVASPPAVIPTATPQVVAATSRSLAIVVSGLVFYDADADGVRDAAEPGLVGAQVAIVRESDVGETWVDYQEVDANGWYTFTLSSPGTYTVYPVHVPPGHRYTTAARATFSIPADEDRQGSNKVAPLDFGLNRRVVPLLLAVLLGLILALLVGTMVVSLRVREAILERNRVQAELVEARLELSDFHRRRIEP